MNITLLANYLPDEQESMQRYAELLERLLTGGGHTVQVLRPAPFFGRLKPSGPGVGKWLGYLDKYILFPFQLSSHVRRQRGLRGPFLVHICDHANAVYTRWLTDVPHLVTAHDMMAIMSARGLIPGQRTGWTGRILQNWILSGLRGAQSIVCITEETRKDMLALAPELAGRSLSIEIPLNYPYAPMPQGEARAHFAQLGLAAVNEARMPRFLLHVGGNQWYKNREGVVRIFAQLCAANPGLTGEPPLILVMAGKPPTAEMRELIAKAGLEKQVRFMTNITNEQLRALYSFATALVFPSLKEGFGWPAIEAQACGCPVVTSDRQPMKRLAGPAGLVADPENAPDFARRIQELLDEDSASRWRRQSAAQVHAENYRPEVYLEKILSAYEAARVTRNF